MRIPERSWFRLSAKAGKDTLEVVFSREAQPVLESALRWSNSRDRGDIADPVARAALRRVLASEPNGLRWQDADASLQPQNGFAVGQLLIDHS